MRTTLDRLRSIMAREYAIAPESLTPEVMLESLGIDSLGTVELLWNIEDEFKIDLPSEPVLLPTVGDVVRYIDEAMAMKSGGGVQAETTAAATLPA